MIITAGSTAVTVPAYFVDDDGGTAPGEPKTGLLFSNIETGGSASYHRQGAARVDFELFTQTAAGAHTDGGFVLLDDTNMPGVYRLDVPDAAFASGADFVVIQLVAAAANNTIMRPLLVDLTTVDLRDSVRGGMTALPNAAAEAAGGLATSTGGATGIDDLATPTNITAGTIATVTDLTNLPSIPANWLTAAGIAATALNGKGDWNIGKTGYSLAATGLDAIVKTATGMVEIAKAVWDRALSGATHNIATSAGRRLRQIEATFVITTGTARAGTANTITLAAGESTTNEIFAGDRIVIVAGTGIGEHGIITTYDGGTQIATMSQNWVITPAADSEYELTPADVDIETWQHVTVTASSTTNLPEVDVKSVSDDATAADNLELDYDGTGFDKANSTIGTTTTNTDMVAAAPAVATIADAVWDEALAGHVTADTAGLLLNEWQDGGRLDLILDARMAEASINTTAGAVDSVTLVATTTVNTDMLAASAILTTALTESYAADGAAPTLTQAIFAVMQQAGEFAISGTTITVKKLDGSTAAMTFTLDDGTNPTSRTRAT